MLAYFALLKLGAIPVALNVMLKAGEVGYVVNDARAVAVIAHQALLENLPPPAELGTDDGLPARELDAELS